MPLSPDERSLCLEHLAVARQQFRFMLFAYVMMPDHAHLLLSAFESELPRIMRDWKSKTGFAIAKLRGVKGAIWQARYFDFILRRASDFSKKLMYIHENPVAAGLAAKAEEWPWSSAAHYISKGKVAVEPDAFDIPVDPNQPLWPVPGR